MSERTRKMTNKSQILHNLFIKQKQKCACSPVNSFLIDGWKHYRFLYLDASSLRTKAPTLFKGLKNFNFKSYQTSIPDTYYVEKIVSHSHLFTEHKMLSLPNPIQYFALVLFLEANTEKLNTIFNNSQSQENPFLGSRWLKDQNCPLAENAKSNPFVANIRRELFASLGFRLKLTFEIENIYSSIYTHQIANLISQWAQIQFANDEEKMLDYAKFGRGIDMHMRNCSLKQTKGIIEGPQVSLLCLELFLTLLDFFWQRELKKVNITYRYVRNYADYSFYFKSNRDFELALNIINDVIWKNKLRLDLSSIKKNRTPFRFNILVSVEKIVNNLMLDRTNVRFLKEMQSLKELETDKRSPSVLKYFLSYLNKKTKDKAKQFQGQTLLEYLQQPVNFLYLLNLLQEKPQLTKKIVPLLSKDTLVKNSKLKVIVQKQIEDQLLNVLEQDRWDENILTQIYLADHLEIKIKIPILKMLFTKRQNFSAFIVLVILIYLEKLLPNEVTNSEYQELWNNKVNLLTDIFNEHDTKLQMMKKTGHPFDDVKDITQTAVWLLLYETVRKGWYDGVFANLIRENTFFKLLLDSNITFLEK